MASRCRSVALACRIAAGWIAGCWIVGSLLLAVEAGAAAVGDPPPTFSTETLMLSGHGPSDAVPWRFRCSEGRGCGEWTTIPVPSNWELQGFGRYDYGYRDDKRPESADYALDFEVPARWRGRAVELVFDAVMTDAQVLLNGALVGSHQGAFTRFVLPVDRHLRFGAGNRLEVRVDEASADASVNRAERDADYWVFGGIYRPVYLLAHPPTHIAHLGIDARADGRIRLDVEVAGDVRSTENVTVAARVRGLGAGLRGGIATPETSVALDDRPVAGPGAVVRLDGRVAGAVPWSAEQPARYEVEVELLAGARILHRVVRRFGFRTVEVRPGLGLFVNGRRVLLKGVNRHAFWPTTGRALDAAHSVADAELIVRLNANAVRTSHYPPDEAFLDACDELGLYVIDELPGWKEAYDTAVGRRLVAEMVRRDAHHASIILWANGNEGGWNERLDAHFALHDPQQRPVIHPDEDFGGFDTVHYPSWRELEGRVHGRRGAMAWLYGGVEGLTLPTEMLHALYDGGGGAGLADYWQLLASSPRAAGGFLWALFDEAVVRTDEGGRIDTAGADAPDGIVDAWRRPEPSFGAVRRIWSPIRIRDSQLLRAEPTGASARIAVQNRFDESDLADCRFDYRWQRWPEPGAPAAVEVATVDAAGTGSVVAGSLAGPATPPGGWGRLSVPWPQVAADVLEIDAVDPRGRLVERFSLPLRRRSLWVRSMVERPRAAASSPAVSVEQTPDRIVLRAAGTVAEIDRASGRLVRFARGALRSPMIDGPRPVAGGEGSVVALRVVEQARGVTVEVRRKGALGHLRWHLDSRGWLRVSYLLDDRAEAPYSGIAFDLDGAAVEAVEWLGREDRVWANRAAGGAIGRFGLRLPGPDFGDAAGYYQDVHWLRLEVTSGSLDIAVEDDNLFVGLGTPRFPDGARTAVAAVPEAPISFMHRIAGIGSKFHRPRDLRPPGFTDTGLENGALWLRLSPR